MEMYSINGACVAVEIPSDTKSTHHRMLKVEECDSDDIDQHRLDGLENSPTHPSTRHISRQRLSFL